MINKQTNRQTDKHEEIVCIHVFDFPVRRTRRL